MNSFNSGGCRRNQRGFTLVEIAIVLMIVGLLIGGVLRGQELITSARVRNIIDQKSSVQAAYLGFVDRYRMLPGDLTAEQAAVVGNGAAGGTWGGNGVVTIATSSALFFQNVAAAGFLSCGNCTATDIGAATVANSPVNIFGGVVQIGSAAGTTAGAAGSFFSPAAAPSRMVLSTGANIDSLVLQEADRKADDGIPGSGSFRYGSFDTNAGLSTCAPGAAAGARGVWANPAASNCEGAWLL